jgi:MYXO-CTERM domain-containing protein
MMGAEVPMLLLAATAHAYTVLCGNGLAVTDTVPGSGAADVPVDVRPAVTFGPSCGALQGWTITLADADGAEVASTSADVSTVFETNLVELFPEADLAPLSGYSLTITPDDSEAVTLGFTTGETTVAGLTGAPTVTAKPAIYDDKTRGLSVELRIVPATDPDQLSVLQVRDADGTLPIQSFVLPGTGEVERTVAWVDLDEPGELCLEVRQFDGAGVATEWASAECVAVGAGCGCASGGAGAGLLGLLVAPLLLLRRRRP